jgi:hypothetical protein
MNEQPNGKLLILALALLGFGAFKATGGKLPLPTPGPAPAPSVPEPAADLKAAVAQVSSLAKGYPTDAAAAAALYVAQARLIEADTGGLLESTDSLRQLNLRAGGLLFAAAGWKGRHPEMGTAIDAAFTQALGGTDNKTLDAALRQRAVAAWRAVAWALAGGN